jgi:hypothetical protein
MDTETVLILHQPRWAWALEQANLAKSGPWKLYTVLGAVSLNLRPRTSQPCWIYRPWKLCTNLGPASLNLGPAPPHMGNWEPGARISTSILLLFHLKESTITINNISKILFHPQNQPRHWKKTYCEGRKELAHTMVKLLLILFSKITGAFMFRIFGGFLHTPTTQIYCLTGAIISETHIIVITIHNTTRYSAVQTFCHF